MNTLITSIAVVLVLGAAYFFLWGTPTPEAPVAESDMGTYHYQCDGFTFAMVPASDVSSITLVPAPGSPFFRTTLSAAGTSRFEGGGIVFTGAGEEVTLSMEEGTYSCSPLPSSEYAPWNWGDAGEGDGSRPDLALIVSESIVGGWQSKDDTKFVRSFASDGTVTDLYESEEVATGTWQVFTSTSNVSTDFPLDPDTAYVKLVMSGSQDESMHFRLVALTPETLELTYMERGGNLVFSRLAQ